MKKGTKEYFKNVLKEINNIKEFATPEEIAELDFNSLQPSQTYNCIYGQMTGDCHNQRGVELIRKCCTTKSCFETITGNETVAEKPRGKEVDGWSYLEHCIVNYQGYNEQIIQYLKGEISVISFN